MSLQMFDKRKMFKLWKLDVTPSAWQEKNIQAVEARCHS